MPNDQPKPEDNHIEGSEPRVVLGIDRGYPPVTASDMAPGERALVDAVIGAGLDMRCAEGFRRPCIIPPAVAIAVVRSLFDDRLGAARSAYHPDNLRTDLPRGSHAVILEGGATGYKSPDGRVWQRQHPSGWVVVNTPIQEVEPLVIKPGEF